MEPLYIGNGFDVYSALPVFVHRELYRSPFSLISLLHVTLYDYMILFQLENPSQECDEPACKSAILFLLSSTDFFHASYLDSAKGPRSSMPLLAMYSASSSPS